MLIKILRLVPSIRRRQDRLEMEAIRRFVASMFGGKMCASTGGPGMAVSGERAGRQS